MESSKHSINLPDWKLFEYVSIGICVIDKNQKIVFWNDMMENLTGVKQSDIYNEAISSIFNAFNQPYIKEQLDQILQGWPPVVFSSLLNSPLFYDTRDLNKELILFIKASGIIEDEDNPYVIISIEDNSDLNTKLEEQKYLYDKAQKEIELRKEVMNKLMESEASLKELDAMKNQLFSIIGHDLRSPIATILQYAAIVKSGKIDISKVNNESFDMIYDLSKSAIDLLQNLLDWAKIQMDGVTFKPNFTNLNDIALNTINQFKQNIEKKNIDIINKLDRSTLIYADPNMLATLIRNLIANSLKYTNSNGTISISSISDNQSDTIIITDSGVGMSKEIQESLFHSKQVSSLEGTNNEKGTGLGLVLCKNIIDKHAGSIQVESSPGIGSTFKIVLPKKTKE